jgi:hypothetical protein
MVERVLGHCAIFICLYLLVCFPPERTSQPQVVLQYSTTVSHPQWHWTHSISNPVDDMVTAKVSFSRNSSLLSKTGRSIRLKQVLERERRKRTKGNTDEGGITHNNYRVTWSPPAWWRLLLWHLLGSGVQTNGHGHSMNGKFTNIPIISLQDTKTARGDTGGPRDEL